MDRMKKKTPKDYRVLYCRAEEHIDEINSLLEKLVEINPYVSGKDDLKKRRNDFIQEALLIGLKKIYRNHVNELHRIKFKNKKMKEMLTTRFPVE